MNKGGLRGYGTVWIYPDRIANILSLCNVQKKHKVTYDSSLKTGFVVHKADGMNHVFMHSKRAYSSLMLKKTSYMSHLTQQIELKINTLLKSTLMPIRRDLYKISSVDLALRTVLNMWNKD